MENDGFIKAFFYLWLDANPLIQGLSLVNDQCAEGHDLLVLRPTGSKAGGLVVAHMDDKFSLEEVQELFELMSWRFIAVMEEKRFLGSSFAYNLTVATVMGTRVIEVKNPLIKRQIWVDTTHTLVAA